jgi:hypothetical protein
VDVGVALVADPQAAEVVQVCEAALEDPAVAAEPGTVRLASARNDWRDPERSQESAVLVVVIATNGHKFCLSDVWTPHTQKAGYGEIPRCKAKSSDGARRDRTADLLLAKAVWGLVDAARDGRIADGYWTSQVVSAR